MNYLFYVGALVRNGTAKAPLHSFLEATVEIIRIKIGFVAVGMLTHSSERICKPDGKHNTERRTVAMIVMRLQRLKEPIVCVHLRSRDC